MGLIRFLIVEVYSIVLMCSGIMATFGFLPLAMCHPPWWGYALFVLNLFVFLVLGHFQSQIYTWQLESLYK